MFCFSFASKDDDGWCAIGVPFPFLPYVLLMQAPIQLELLVVFGASFSLTLSHSYFVQISSSRPA